MKELTSTERIRNILNRKPVDRIGLFEHFWGDTLKVWQNEGKIAEGESLGEHFGHDIVTSWCFNNVADLDFEPIVIEEDDEKILTKDGNGAFLRRHKLHNATPEHVDFTVKDRASWEEYIVPKLKPETRRINFDGYAEAKNKASENNRFFMWSGVNVFESIHPVCGHENMLMGMALDPDWVSEMADTYAEMFINMFEELVAGAGKPDGVWFYEDMGFKQRPFMSPAMYRELIMPAHKKTIDYAHSLGLPVVMHSCGFIEPLLPGMIEAGIDCLQVLEVKAGMDPIRVKKQFGDDIVIFGGMDSRNLVANDIDAIKKELQKKIPVLKENYGYILHSDHSIPTDTKYETYRYFVDEGLKLGKY